MESSQRSWRHMASLGSKELRWNWLFMEFSFLALACTLGKFWDFMPTNSNTVYLVHFRPCISQCMGSNWKALMLVRISLVLEPVLIFSKVKGLTLYTLYRPMSPQMLEGRSWKCVKIVKKTTPAKIPAIRYTRNFMVKWYFCLVHETSHICSIA